MPSTTTRTIVPSPDGALLAFRRMAPVVLAAAMVMVPLAATPAKASTTAVPTVTPQSAQAFVDSVGVVTHFRYQDQTYGQSDRLLASLQRLGVHHIRDGLPMSPSADLVNVFRELPQHDLKLNVVLGTAGGKNRNTLPPASQ